MRMAFNKSETPLQPKPRQNSSMKTSHFNVGESLKAAQKEAGVSNLDLAEDFNVCKQTVTRWRLKEDQKVSVVFALAEYFNKSFESFLELGR
jgi:DNA-binding XRE family transcriptional regulator